MKIGTFALLTTLLLALAMIACGAEQSGVRAALPDGPALVVFYTDN
jgi:hypothetical protein